MLDALRGGLTLIVLIVVLKLFLPDIAAALVALILKVITIANYGLDHAQGALPR